MRTRTWDPRETEWISILVTTLGIDDAEELGEVLWERSSHNTDAYLGLLEWWMKRVLSKGRLAAYDILSDARARRSE